MSNAPATGEGPEALGSSSLCEDTHRAADGLVVVPREPTEAMLDAGQKHHGQDKSGVQRNSVRAAYRAMIAATQQPAGKGVRGLTPEVEEVAREAALRAGKKLNDWITDALHKAAALSATQQPVVCGGCDGRGEIGGAVGQTAETFEWVTEPCPDCATQRPVWQEIASDPRVREIGHLWLAADAAGKVFPGVFVGHRIPADAVKVLHVPEPTPIGEEKPEGGRP